MPTLRRLTQYITTIFFAHVHKLCYIHNMKTKKVIKNPVGRPRKDDSEIRSIFVKKHLWTMLSGIAVTTGVSVNKHVCSAIEQYINSEKYLEAYFPKRITIIDEYLT
jgi:hypothetical protein